MQKTPDQMIARLQKATDARAAKQAWGALQDAFPVVANAYSSLLLTGEVAGNSDACRQLAFLRS